MGYNKPASGYFFGWQLELAPDLSPFFGGCFLSTHTHTHTPGIPRGRGGGGLGADLEELGGGRGGMQGAPEGLLGGGVLARVEERPRPLQQRRGHGGARRRRRRAGQSLTGVQGPAIPPNKW